MSARLPASALRPLANVRASLRAQWAAAFQHALSATGTTKAAVAEACGVSPSKVNAWANGSDGEPLPNALHLMAMPACIRSELRAWEATRDLCVVLPVEPDALEHGSRIALLTCELSDVTRCYTVAIADGALSGAERAELVRELREAGDVIARALMALEQKAVG